MVTVLGLDFNHKSKQMSRYNKQSFEVFIIWMCHQYNMINKLHAGYLLNYEYNKLNVFIGCSWTINNADRMNGILSEC